eukprot:Sspe_Gene.70613::Locus_41704_Transcript_1_1_Confidence_1.000_Length_2328::g.70613::m.70613
MAKKGDDSDPSERALEALFCSEFVLVIAGPEFTEDSSRSPFLSEYCTPTLVRKPNKFMGFWGEVCNRYLDKNPHDGFAVLKKWRDSCFDPRGEDIRKRKGPKKKTDEEEEQQQLTPKCFVVTSNVDGFFGRVGFDPDQVLELNGNVTTWQCTIPCTQQVWPIDKHFRFEIDPTNLEALPTKYVNDERDIPVTPQYEIVDEEHEPEPTEGSPAATDPKRLRRKLMRATTIRVHHQLNAEKYTDHFVGYPTTTHDVPVTLTYPTDTTAPTLSSPEADEIDEQSEEPQQAAPPIAFLPLPPLSHRLQHVKALDKGEYAYQEGEFHIAVDPLKAADERRSFYSMIQPFFNQDDPRNTQLVEDRRKRTWYNISVFIVDETMKKDHLFFDGREGSSLAKGVPTDDRPESSPSGEVTSGDHGWFQGKNSQYYFSNVKSSCTLQEPIEKKFHDVVRVSLPIFAEDRLPTMGKISTVIEVLEAPKEFPKPKEPTAGPIENPYSRRAVQLVGRFELQEKTGGTTQVSTTQPEGDEGTEKELEHVLETNERKQHIFKIGVSASALRNVRYFEWEIGCEDLAQESSDVGTVWRRPVDKSGQEQVLQSLQDLPRGQRRDMRRSGAPRPAANHHLCRQCHTIARPHVQMAARDLVLVPISKRPYQLWERYVLDQMKLDSSKQFLVLELGCTKKMEVCRRHGESVWKKTKAGGRSYYVRIAADDLEVKKGKGAGQDSDNFITIVADPKEALKRLDRMLVDRLRKKQL